MNLISRLLSNGSEIYFRLAVASLFLDQEQTYFQNRFHNRKRRRMAQQGSGIDAQ